MSSNEFASEDFARVYGRMEMGDHVPSTDLTMFKLAAEDVLNHIERVPAYELFRKDLIRLVNQAESALRMRALFNGRVKS